MNIKRIFSFFIALFIIAALDLFIAMPSNAQQILPIAGYVRDFTGKPVAGALVTLINEGGESSGPSDTTYTAVDGLFHFINKPEGIYSLNVSAEGFLSFQDSVQMTFETRRIINVTLNKNNEYEEGTIYLGKSAGNIIGTVICDDNDEPVSDAVVSSGEKFVQTNDAGSFKINDLGIGEKKIRIQKNGFEKMEKDITITPKTQNLVIRLTRIVKYSTVLGRVKILDRKDYECPPIKVYMGGKTTVTDYKGSFRFENVREGSYPILLIYNKKEVYNDVIKVSRGVSAYEIIIDKL
ncbi:MAG TPA: carboxypeptidase regulatory-like domain-containing protein [Candidatus Wallbacteria bacterium]|nr:carboxypeptidase regulatory-like domain-containing protein [Candidatus Wallbacteria bacterium]